MVDPAAWTGRDLHADQSWVFELTGADLEQLLAMVKRVRGQVGDDPNKLLELAPAAFDLGAFSSKMAAIRHELTEGRGAALVRGLPMAQLDLIDAATVYWALGRHLGTACSNNPEGDMLGHVTDKGKSQGDPHSRGYQTREEMAFHTDQSSIVGLMCVRTPASGGLSKIASSVTVYNEMLKRAPECVETLAQPFCWTKHGEVNEGEPGYYESPVVNFLEGTLNFSFGPTHIRKGHDLPEAPDLTEAQHTAIRVAEQIAEEHHYAMQFQPGDIQLLNNSVALHTRTEYQDWPDPAKKRLLWRLWLINPEVRPLSPYVRQWRDGVKLSSTRERIVL